MNALREATDVAADRIELSPPIAVPRKAPPPRNIFDVASSLCPRSGSGKPTWEGGPVLELAPLPVSLAVGGGPLGTAADICRCYGVVVGVGGSSHNIRWVDGSRAFRAGRALS